MNLAKVERHLIFIVYFPLQNKSSKNKTIKLKGGAYDGLC